MTAVSTCVVIGRPLIEERRCRFDTVKTRIQVAPQYYTGAIDCFWKIVRNEVCLASLVSMSKD